MNSFLVKETSLLYPTATEVADLSPFTNRSLQSVDSNERQDEVTSNDQDVSTVCTDRCNGHDWSIDGGEDGIRFFAVPDFAHGKPPLRIDVYVPQLADPSLDLLKHEFGHVDLTCASSNEIVSSRAATTLNCILSQWSAEYKDFANAYRQLPYGSYIVVEKGDQADGTKIEVSMVPDLSTEQAWLSVDVLQAMWSFPSNTWPDILDWTQVRLQSQPHNAISLVTLAINDDQIRGQTFVYKSVLRDLQHFYHELKMLLSIPPHPNIIGRPLFIVTKKARFGGKRGVCGMILKYYPEGTLYDALLHTSEHYPLRLQDQISIAKQITRALVHVRDSIGFYTNLKPHNIILAREAHKYKAILIDFEQRSGWFSWSAPEIYYVNYCEHLARFSTDSSRRTHYKGLLQDYIPGWEPLDMKTRYSNRDNGYSSSWAALSRKERESAQVFMLGKLLWCIFESAHHTSSCVTPETMREPACKLTFPTFSSTPDRRLRSCIRQCTQGAPEWEGYNANVIKRGEQIYNFKDVDCIDLDIVGIQRSAKEWWIRQINQAELFIKARSRICNDSQQATLEDLAICAFMSDRPALEDVLNALTEAEGESCWIP